MPDAFDSDDNPTFPRQAGTEAAMVRLLRELADCRQELARRDEDLLLARRELTDVRNRYNALSHFAPVGCCVLTADATVREANATLAALLLQSPADLVGRPLTGWLAAKDRHLLTDSLERVRSNGQPDVLELRLVRQDGTVRHAVCQTRGVTGSRASADDDGAFFCMVHDDTTCHEADETMRLAEHILENSPALLLRCRVHDGEPGPIEYVSANAARFGFSREILLSGTCSPRDLVHPDDLPTIENAIRHNAATGHDAFGLNYRLRTPQGHIRHVTDRVQLGRDNSGTVTRIDWLILDVTDSVVARTDLETVLDNAPIPIVKIRLTEDGQRLIDYQNPAAERLFGPDAPGHSCQNYLCHEACCPVLASPSGLVREQECDVTTLHGPRVMYKTACRMPDEPYIIEAMVDVTELMRTRERLTRAMEAAEAANKAKSQFLATMSHEIRTPMNGIMGMTELALDTNLTEEQREYLELARQSAVSLLEIINDILDFSRIEAGRMELSSTPFNLRQSLDSSLRLLRPLAERQHDSVELDIASDVPEVLIGDAGRLAQIVVNLVSNGLKFTRDGSVRVTVETTPAIQCPLDADPTLSCTLLFAVSDTGIGIPRDKQQRIFDYFTQLDASLNRGAGGTGLGLSISKNLVNLMGGRLWLESEPGHGSTFFFTTPLKSLGPAEPTRPDEDLSPESAAFPRPLRLLLVEDNCINQLVAKRLLERRGHAVDAVDSGQAALELLEQRRYDVVLMDVEMPGLSGMETLDRLRDAAVFGETAATPVVALTAHAAKGFHEKMLARGFDGYVSKPIDRRALDEALATAVAVGTARAASA